ncbi:MAG: hypothetical protein RL662_12 [Bacteroidota bacterium]|jgi:hypothetical protein
MENKESIKHRMYKNAARLWDVKNVDNLDPLIKLLIESLSSEVYKLSTDINNIEIRLLERMSQLLTPDMLIIPQPAHMIMTTQPVEENAIIDKMGSFLFDDTHKTRVSGSLTFRPVNRFSLVKGYIKAIICGGNFYNIDSGYNKDMVARTSVRSEVFNNSVWIGLDIDKRVRNLDNLSIFFDFPNIPELKNNYLPLLSFTKWSYQDKPLKTTMGIHTCEREEGPDTSHFFTQYDLLNLLDTKILNHYSHHFISIKDGIVNDQKTYEKIPSEIACLFSEKLPDAIESPLLWIKVNFPPNFTESILTEIMVSINAFPVANKELRSIFSKSKKMANIIPLTTEEKEFFLCTNTVMDEFNNTYEYLPYKNEDRPRFGTYTIKRGGVERFDTRDAKEYISNLIDLLRDESVAFSLLGKDYLYQAVEDMKTKIAIMEQKLRDVNKNKEISSYLVVDSDDQSESIFVEYWTTNCEFGNNIKAGTILKPSLNLFLEASTTFSLTSSLGGRSIPKANNKLDMYKYILTTRDRIFTPEDITNFCYSEFGDYFSLVEVRNGVQISDKPKQGLIRTIDVHVTMKSEFGHYVESKQEISSRLLKLLNEKSPDAFNYRIFFKINNK